MIDFVRGKIDELTPTTAVIECAGGVGYALNISLNTFSAIQGKPEAKLYVYEAIREDAWVLYGFISRSERSLFLLLLTVSGVGGNTARMVLSSFSVPEMVSIITEGNDRLLATVKKDYFGIEGQGGFAGYRTSIGRWRIDFGCFCQQRSAR